MVIWLREFLRKRRIRKELKRCLKMKVNQVTKHYPWTLYTTITSTASALGDDEKKAAAMDSHNPWIVGEALSNLEVRISANITGRTGTARFYASRKDDDICFLGSSAITSGLQVATGEYFYVDTMTLTDRWITEVRKVDADGNDGMSRLVFDFSGYDKIFVLIEYAGDTIWKIDFSGFA